MIEIYEGAIYRENFKISPFRKVRGKKTSKQKYRNENIDLMQALVKLVMNSLYSVQMRRDNNESYYCKSETWMKTEYDGNVLDYWKLSNRMYIVKMKTDDGLDDEIAVKIN